MGFTPETLAVLAYANGFTLMHYETADEAHHLLDPSYFKAAAGLLRRGDLIFASCASGDTRKTSLLLVTGVGNGQVSIESLEATVASTHPASLTALTDVTLANPTDGQILAFRKGSWVNQSPATPSDLTAATIGAIAVSEKGQANGVATLDGEGKVPAAQLRAIALANLRDVAAVNPVINDVLKYDGTRWNAAPQIGAVGDAFAASHLASGSSAHKTATATEAGFMASADKIKLDSIDPNATGSKMTGAEIKAAYEAEANTNAFTDAEKAKLAQLVGGGTLSFGTAAGTVCEGNDDRIPDPTEQSFLATISKSGNDFTITPPNDGGIAINSTPPARTAGFAVYSGGTRPAQPTNDALVFLGGPSDSKTNNLYVLGIQAQSPSGELVVLKNHDGNMVARTRTDDSGGFFTQYYHYDQSNPAADSTRKEVFACRIYQKQVLWVFGGSDTEAAPNNIATFIGDVTVKGNLTVTGTLTITDGVNSTVYGPKGIV